MNPAQVLESRSFIDAGGTGGSGDVAGEIRLPPLSIRGNSWTLAALTFSHHNNFMERWNSRRAFAEKQRDWNFQMGNSSGRISMIGSGGDLLGLFDIGGQILSTWEPENRHLAMGAGILGAIALKKPGLAANTELAAEKSLLINSGITKKGILKADYLFANMNDAKNFGASALGPSKVRMYNSSGKWIGWENKLGDKVYWGHGDWGKGVGSSTFPHLNYIINGQKGHLFLQNKIINRGQGSAFNTYFNLGN
ncbi:hypothetical protein ACFQO9_09410 [Chryseobacterium zhengzhouense]|uniref:Bacterial toxin 23 domain-containing protein n=1 Tax=Chryseobacterium zhengzhouense TaxID=1636086 RepID=A0ABW2LZ43_9FLAO